MNLTIYRHFLLVHSSQFFDLAQGIGEYGQVQYSEKKDENDEKLVAKQGSLAGIGLNRFVQKTNKKEPSIDGSCSV